jgi:perosamine synthetase
MMDGRGSPLATPEPRVAAPKRSRDRRSVRRRIGLLGGTTTSGDVAVALRHLLDRRSLVEGPAIAEYERAFARQIGVAHACSFATGRVGLFGILKSLGIGEGDEVLLQLPTHIVVPNAVRYTGARPVFVDCTLDSYTMDLDDAERRVTPRTRAIVLQHTFGIPTDMDRALELARRHGLEVIEDCVHSLGSTYDGRPLGSLGRAAFFSTEETKTISTTMGGMVVTDDPELAARLREFHTTCAPPARGLTARYVLKLAVYHVLTEPHVHRYSRAAYERLGRRNPLPQATDEHERRGLHPPRYEQRLSNAQANLGLRQLRRLRENVAHRVTLAEAYRSRLGELGFDAPRVPAAASAAFVRYPVWVEDRPAAVQRVAPYAVLGTWFTSVLEEAESPSHADYVAGSCPNAETAARHLVNLPTHLRVGERDVEAITSALGGGDWRRLRG